MSSTMGTCIGEIFCTRLSFSTVIHYVSDAGFLHQTQVNNCGKIKTTTYLEDEISSGIGASPFHPLDAVEAGSSSFLS